MVHKIITDIHVN